MKLFGKKILKDLYQSTNGLYVYTFYERYRISPKEIFFFIDKFSKDEIILYDDDRIQLTEKGKGALEKKKIVFKKRGASRSIPEEFKGPVIGINECYLPNIENIPEEILK